MNHSKHIKITGGRIRNSSTPSVIPRTHVPSNIVKSMDSARIEELHHHKQNDSVYIVCGGTSLHDFPFHTLAERDTIVVNSALREVPNPNLFITVDYTFLRKFGTTQVLSYPVPKVFVADFSYPFIKERNGYIVDERYGLVYRDISSFQYIIKSHTQKGLGRTYSEFCSGRNSGYSAFQLAVLMGYKKIYFLGLDLMCSPEKTHYHDGYGESNESFANKLNTYFEFFRVGLSELKNRGGVQVFSCSKSSRLNSVIPYYEYC